MQEAFAVQFIDIMIIAIVAALLYFYIMPAFKRKMRGAVNYISPQDLNKRIQDDEDILIIDVRRVAEFNSMLGHIEDAINIPFSEMAEKLDTNEKELAAYKDTPVIIVAFKDGNEGFIAYKTFQNKGFSNIFLLDKGITAWVRCGLPITSK